jgi:cytochrome c553
MFAFRAAVLIAALSVALPVSSQPAAAQAPAPPPEIAEKVKLCVSCHGEDGRPVRPDVPVIWGQEYYYLLVQLRDYQAGRRANEVMQPVVAALENEALKPLAQYFSERKWPELGFRASEQDVAVGQRVAVGGQCPQCHLGGFKGNSRVPRLAGQSVTYLEKTMLDFKTRVRRNAADMSSLMDVFSEAEITAMAHYIAGQ